MTLGTALKISKGHMWRGQIEDKPGTFAEALKPFANSGSNLQVVAGWSQSSPTQKHMAGMEIFPITDEKAKQSAKEAGLQEMTEIVYLIIEGEDSSGLAYKMTKAISEAGVNIRHAMLQSIKQSFVACFGFSTDADAEKAKAALQKL